MEGIFGVLQGVSSAFFWSGVFALQELGPPCLDPSFSRLEYDANPRSNLRVDFNRFFPRKKGGSVTQWFHVERNMLAVMGLLLSSMRAVDGFGDGSKDCPC